MGVYTLAQITDIILKNPNKDAVKAMQDTAKRLRMHIRGKGLKEAMKREDYFENADIYRTRTERPTSNKDLFSRLLQQEMLVFTARGGSSHFNMPSEQERQMNAMLDDVYYSVSLRRWVATFGISAYRRDPGGLIFMEVEQLLSTNGQQVSTPKCYPTYKSIDCIFDYLPAGRNVEYVCFRLSAKEALEFGITDAAVSADSDNIAKQPGDKKTNYYRFVDDKNDFILKLDNNNVVIANTGNLQNPVPVPAAWSKCPAIIASDLMDVDQPNIALSPLDDIVELADDYLYDRSIRNLQKKYHGFAKAVEPLLKCSTCDGEGFTKGIPCPDCTIPGHDRGTGYKLRTKVSDVARFPLEIFENAGGFDFAKIFGYITPDIQSWNKQDLSLEDLEQLLYTTYWGAAKDVKTSGARLGAAGGASSDTTQETATKTLSNLQPKYARLNATADWAEKTENLIATFIGKFWFDNQFKGSNISYGRNYILETPEDLMSQYQDARTKGAPDFILDEMLERYLRSLYQSNLMEMTKYLKLLKVEPFPHISMMNAQTVVLNENDLYAKLYFGEWKDLQLDAYFIDTTVEKMREDLRAYAAVRMKEQEQNYMEDLQLQQQFAPKPAPVAA